MKPKDLISDEEWTSWIDQEDIGRTAWILTIPIMLLAIPFVILFFFGQ